MQERLGLEENPGLKIKLRFDVARNVDPAMDLSSIIKQYLTSTDTTEEKKAEEEVVQIVHMSEKDEIDMEELNICDFAPRVVSIEEDTQPFGKSLNFFRK